MRIRWGGERKGGGRKRRRRRRVPPREEEEEERTSGGGWTSVAGGQPGNADVTCDLRKTKHQPVTREGVFRETTYLCGVCLKPIKKTLKLIYYGLKKIRVVACIVAMMMMMALV